MIHRMAFLIPILLTASLAIAQERRIPRPEEWGSRPIEITAQRLLADGSKNSVTFEGEVIAKQDDLTLFADRLFAEYDQASGSIEKIVADGNVRVLQGDREARSPHAVFFNMEQRIVMSGGADVTQGGNTLKGDTVTVYILENRSVVSGGEGGRVRAVIQPRPQEKKGKNTR